MWKRCLALIACCVTICSLAACGQNKPAPKKLNVVISQETRDQLTQIAQDFETQSRTWGVNPTISDQIVDMDSVSALNTVRTSETLTKPVVLDSITLTDNAGSNAPSPYCNNDPESVGCQTQPTMLDYWRQQHWSMGAAVDTHSIRVTVNQPTIATVSGTVTIILWSDTTGVKTVYDHWGFTPVKASVPFRDKLTIIGGRVVKRQSLTATPWIADPWLSVWDTNPAEQVFTDRQQPSYALPAPVPSLGLQHDPTVAIVTNSQVSDGLGWDKVIPLPEESTLLNDHPSSGQQFNAPDGWYPGWSGD